jgi:hypothetical protein
MTDYRLRTFNCPYCKKEVTVYHRAQSYQCPWTFCLVQAPTPWSEADEEDLYEVGDTFE